MRPLTALQSKVLSYLEQRALSGHTPPTLREVGLALGRRGTAIWYPIDVLQRRGYLKREKGKNRAIQLARRPERPAPGRFIAPRVCEWDDCRKTYFGEICPCIKGMLA